MNATIEKLITLLKVLAIDGKEVGKLSIDILAAYLNRKKMRVPKIRKNVAIQYRNKIKMLTWFAKVERKQVVEA